MKRGRGILLGLACALLPQAAQAGGGIDALADRYLALRLKLAPGMIPLAGIATIRQSELPLIDPKSLAAVAAEEDRLLQALQAVDPAGLDPAGRSSYALMIEGLEASRGLRVCHQPLWGLNHIGGWQVDFQDLAAG